MSDQDNNTLGFANGIRLTRRNFLAVLSSAAAVTTLSGPGSLLAQARNNGGVLTISAPANPSSLDPATGGSGTDHVFLFPMFDTLVEWDYETLEPKPGLARSWEFPDERTLVLHLQEGVEFHDGEPMDAEAVRFNLERARTDDRSNIRSDLATVETVEITGDLEVTLHLKEPDTALPLILSDRAGMMVSRKAVEELDDRHDRYPVGAGAMKFVTWDDGDRVAMERNENYWKDDRPLLDGIDFRVMTDSSTRLRAVMSGQSEVAYHLDGRQQQLLERGGNAEGISGPSVYCYQLYINASRDPLTNAKVRQAINHAVDREAFVHATMAGAGEPAYMNLPRDHWAFDPEVAELYPYDPDRARELLKEAGYPDGVELDLRGYTDQASVQRQELLLEQFEKAGIRGRFRTGTIAEVSAAFFGSEKAGDLLLSAWTGRPDPSLSYALMYLEDAYFNSGRVAPPEGFNEALQRSRSTDDLDERAVALSEVQRLVMESAMVVPLAFRQDIIAYSTEVQGLRPNLLGKPKFEDVYLEA
ncbi:ABC transporter substrate-binding protein [Aquisalimonas sp. APHAB1-3]|uniref:ABC transporter substrate-binding protein n=1 Tax=Aquisalimonas sp. APHAB1-3 TaxID=3402080 RepID=UPI003AB02EF7